LNVQAFCVDTWLVGARPQSAVDTPDSFNDGFAQYVYGDYRRNHGGGPWDECAEQERWFNRYAADHAQIKRDLLVRAGERAPIELAAIDRYAEPLSRLEHRRYVVERMLDGWLRRSVWPKINRYHLNPTLAPFDDLPPEEQKKDMSIVQLLTKYEERASE
jgi:hypothetical protein